MSLPPEAVMDKGAFAERRGEDREPLFFEISEPEPVAPPPPPGPPEPVLLFKPREPSPLVRGARALLTSRPGWSRRPEARSEPTGVAPNRLTGSALTVPGTAAPATALRLAREGRSWSLDAPVDVAPAGPLIKLLTWVVAGICAAVWALVGALFWLPVVLAAVAHFAVAHLQGMLDGVVPRAAGAGLRSAASFYMRGFYAALDIALSPGTGRPSRLSPAPTAGLRIDKGRLLRATGWACLSWYAALFAVGLVDSPHVELAELASSLGGTMASVLADVAGAAARVSVEGIPGP